MSVVDRGTRGERFALVLMGAFAVIAPALAALVRALVFRQALLSSASVSRRGSLVRSHWPLDRSPCIRDCNARPSRPRRALRSRHRQPRQAIRVCLHAPECAPRRASAHDPIAAATCLSRACISSTKRVLRDSVGCTLDPRSGVRRARRGRRRCAISAGPVDCPYGADRDAPQQLSGD